MRRILLQNLALQDTSIITSNQNENPDEVAKQKWKNNAYANSSEVKEVENNSFLGGTKKRVVYHQEIALGGGGWCFLFLFFFNLKKK